jgi:uncharacterized membrane protein
VKAIKVILIIISIISVGFFATGLIMPETKYQTSIEINKNIDEVFQSFSDIKNSKDWVPELKSVGVRKEVPAKIGSVYELVAMDRGVEIIIIQKITSFENNHSLGISFQANDMNKFNQFSFESKGNTTVITLDATCRSDSYMLSCIFPYFKGFFRDQDDLYLQNFKSYIESKS